MSRLRRTLDRFLLFGAGLQMSTMTRLAHLDGLRGLAAMQVVISHVNLLGQPRILDASAAVILFFVLSGYCLALPFERGDSVSIRTFYVRRFFRLYPAFFACMLFTLACALVFNPEGVEGTYLHAYSGFRVPQWEEFAKHLLLVYPRDQFADFNPPVWSLVFEAQMSLIFPILMLMRARPSVSAFALALAVAAALLVPSTTLTMISTFWLGTLAALYRRKLTRGAPWMLLCGLCFYFVPNLLTDEIKSPSEYKLYVLVVAVGAAFIILASESSNEFRSLLSARVPQFLGRISYSLYLFHFPLILTLVSIWGDSLLTIIIGVVASIVVGMLGYRWVERPWMRPQKRDVVRPPVEQSA